MSNNADRVEVFAGIQRRRRYTTEQKMAFVQEAAQPGITISYVARRHVPCFTPVRSPQSNGMAESFVKTFKRDYVYVHDRPDAQTVLSQWSARFEDYNDSHPHKVARRAELAASTESSVSVVSRRIIRLPTAPSNSDRTGTTTMETPI